MMKATLTADAEVLHSHGSAADVAAAPVVPGRLADYLELTKPRIAVLALFTVGAGYLLGAGALADPARSVPRAGRGRLWLRPEEVHSTNCWNGASTPG